MKLRSLCFLFIIANTLYSVEENISPIHAAAIKSLGAKLEAGAKRECDPDVKITPAMASYLNGITWPKGKKFRWKDTESDIGRIIYYIDFDCPIERVTPEHYGTKAYDGCLVIAETDHGQLVIPPTELGASDPVVSFLDNDDEAQFGIWNKRKMKLSVFIANLIVDDR